MENFKFNHDVETMGDALGISKERQTYIRGLITFYMMYGHVLLNQLFDNSDEAPANLRTKSGSLEKMFDHAENEAERVLMTWDYCSVDIKHRDDPRGLAMMAMTAMKIEEVNMDVDKFMTWFLERAKWADSQEQDED